MPFTVAIVGRPNVGKSTLFNRLAGRRLALVDDSPGVTRDWRAGKARLGDLDFEMLDTAGFDDTTGDVLPARMRRHTEKAIARADACLFLVDARAGITPLDRQFAQFLRRTGRPVILVANKCEGRRGEEGVLEAYALGLGDPVRISAEHGEGMADLYEALRPLCESEAAVEAAAKTEQPDKPLRLAVVGRPNTGKSTLINRLAGEERLLTGPEAGITRDAIAVDWSWEGRPMQLYDTAGLRKRARVTERIERLSVADTRRAIQFAEVVVLVIDVSMPFERQDLHIADLVEQEGRALVVAINKWDLVAEPRKTLRELTRRFDELLPQLRGAPLIPLSALTGGGMAELMPAVLENYDIWNRRIPTAALNRWLEQAVAAHTPPAVQGRRIKLRYATQPKARPPTFVIFASRPKHVPPAYRRYLVNSLREHFGLAGVPVRLHLRGGKNPYVQD